MQKSEALNLLKGNLKNNNLIKHSFAVSAAMGKLAEYFGADREKWAVCGLLHDIDYEKTGGEAKSHSKVGAEMLAELGLAQETCYAVLSHNEVHGIQPETRMAKALFCADPLTGLIAAAALVLPSKKIQDLKVENVLNRFKEKSFAKGANREVIKKCGEYLNLPLEKFIEITLGAMKEISGNLGL